MRQQPAGQREGNGTTGAVQHRLVLPPSGIDKTGEPPASIVSIACHPLQRVRYPGFALAVVKQPCLSQIGGMTYDFSLAGVFIIFVAGDQSAWLAVFGENMLRITVFAPDNALRILHANQIALGGIVVRDQAFRRSVRHVQNHVLQPPGFAAVRQAQRGKAQAEPPTGGIINLNR